MRSRLVRSSTLVVSGLTVVMIVLGLWLAVVNRDVPADAPIPEPVGAFVGVQLSSAIVWIVAAVVLLRRPEIGWSILCALTGLSHAAAAVGFGWAVRVFVAETATLGGDVAVWVTIGALPFEVLALNWMAMTLPDGLLPTGRLRWLTVATVLMTAAGLVAAAASRLDVSGTDFARAQHPLRGGLDLPQNLPVFLLAPTALIVLVMVWVRWRASVGDVRLAMRRIVVISVLGLAIPSLFLARPEVAVGVAQVVGALQVLAMVAVVLRHRLFGIDTVLERAVLYSMLACLLLMVYVGLVAAGDVVFDGSVGPFAAVAVALAALPARDHLSRLVARFMYGDRDQPQRVVESVIRRAGLAAGPQDMVRDVLGEIATGLRFDRLAVSGPDGAVMVQIGADTSSRAESFDLVHRGRLVGVLEAEPRPGEDRLDATDRVVVGGLSAHLAAMVDAAFATMKLRESRDRLVHVREEERRRLRRDLHDGLGPVLTGVALTTDAAVNTIRRDPEGASALLLQARAELTGAIGEIRRLVEDLRPPLLDELGLVGAIRQHAHRFPELTIRVQQDGALPALQAAVEVAAYRITTEALANVARHADAHEATVRLHLNGNLELEITDDGRHPGPWVSGVGLTSMTERAGEIGGTIIAGPAGQGGRVLALLPVDA